MGQTIICEYLAAWESAGVAPEPKDFGFDGLYAMLEECQETMFSLGESVNRAKERIAELELDLVKHGVTIKQYQLDHEGLYGSLDKLLAENDAKGKRIAELEAALDRTKKQLFNHTN